MSMVHRFTLAAGFALALALAFTFTGCEEAKPSSSNILGAWEAICNSKGKSKESSVEFFNDGTGILSEDKGKAKGMSFKWQLRDGNRLQWEVGNETAMFDIKLSEKGKLLTLSLNSDAAVYIKKGEEIGGITNASSTFTDARDGKKYKAVKIGEQTWMAENLNYESEGSECYDNDPANCAKYGRLYNYETAIKDCPAGWHLPTNAEWNKLYRYADGTYRCVDSSQDEKTYTSKTAGKFLKATSGWGENGNGTDKYGFAAIPGGGTYYKGRQDCADNNGGVWWSVDGSGSNAAAYTTFICYNSEDTKWVTNFYTDFFSVRCVKN